MQASDTYQVIFSERGKRYHAAMCRHPEARASELRLLPERLGIRRGHTVVDAPSGGGYLAEYLNTGVDYIAVEQVAEFYQRCPEAPGRRKVLCPLSAIELPNACADAVISLAGLHHEPQIDQVFGEFYRLLRPGGMLGVADAESGSSTDRFLNGLVNDLSSAGHRGQFFDDSIADRLRSAGLEQVRIDRANLHWRFPDEMAMIGFARDLFGLDRGTDGEIYRGIETILGTSATAEGGIAMHWELMVVTARRPEGSPHVG